MSGRRELGAVLLKKARADANAATAVAEDRRVSDEIVGFHCQQAAEKAIKSVLEASHVTFPRTHDLVQLLALLGDAAIAAPVGLDDAIRLNPFGVILRYVDEDDSESEDTPAFDRPYFVRLSIAVVDWAEVRLAAK